MFSVLCTIVVAKLLDYKFYKFMEDIHEFGILEKSLFKSYLLKGWEKDINDFKPTSLIVGMYKLLADFGEQG